jgi:branched-chain amino acid transport system substrate-binding protein
MQPFDQPPVRGAQFAIDDINAKGGVLGRKLKLVTADYHSKVEDSGPVAQDLLGQKAQLIITACDFDFGSPAAQAAQRKNVLGFSTCAGSIQFGPQGIGKLAFTMGNAGRTEGAAIAEFAFKDRNLRQAFMLHDNTLLYYNEVCTGFKQRFTELGGAVAGETTFKPKDITFDPQINSVRSLQPAPDLLFLCGFPTAGAPLMRQLRSAGFAQPIMSSNTYDGNYWKGAVPDLSNFFYANYASLYGDDPSSAVNAFFGRYKTAYGSVPDNSNAITGYAVIQAFQQAAEHSKSLEGDKLASALEAAGNMDLLALPTQYTAQFHIALNRRQEIMVVSGGQTRFLKYWELTKPPATSP